MTAPRLATNARDASKTSRNKWVVLGACFAVNFISSALFRNAALFYPSIMDTFLVTRERAALPLFVYGGCFHLGALLGGTVIQVLTVWAAAVAGGLLLSATFIASSFANGTAFLTAVLGVLGGTGQGIIFNCSVVGLADYFSSRRGLALGVVMTGAPAASFIFPPIFDHALELYGLRVIVDYSADSGVAQSDAVHILSFFSVTDALCRLVIPLLSDCKVLSTTVLLAGSYLLVSVLAGGLAFLKGKIGFWIVALALGLPCGYINVGLSESLSAIAGAENLPMAIGFMSAAAAVGSFTTPSLIGLFRDIYGSYDDLFFIMAGALMVAFGLFAVLLVISLTRSKKVTVSR
ncbi:hypothetical protein HPB50_000233 [Hyalomma asiaticum]|uniref:Uncharacterized protein n=1 Tax=Hyalomma asiaticum TaxID=266040 RepID=A0ACB7SCT8_HYAAI|nr:hypothetical protein HPB50_000233 [Hyalomma asiaticum]